MKTTCKNCQTHFDVTEKDVAFYTKMKVPSPTLCPSCRMQRRLAFRNDRSLYNSKSALSGKELITMYDPAHGFTVYDQKEWWSEEWDGLTYGRAFDFNRPFFPQFAELQKIVPRFNVFNLDTENCEYVNYAPHCKNCYLLFGSWFDEDCLYGQTLNECKNCVDNLFLDKSELCSENIDSNHNYNSHFCQNTTSTTDSYFCFDCQNVQNCIGCWNLRNKSYHILNKPVSKEQYEAERAKFTSRRYVEKFKQDFYACLRTQALHRDFIGLNNENASGNFVFNSQNAQYCFSVYRSQDVAFCGRMFDQKDTYDFDGGGKGELLYENMSNDFSYNSIGCTTCEHLNDAHYCDLCFSCSQCFGCVGLRSKKFCIFNQQYTQAEYEKLVPKLIEHMQKTEEWGEFFPISLSPFAYNETLAQEYFPITPEEAQQKNYQWAEESPAPADVKPLPIPDDIRKTSPSILTAVLPCGTCKKSFRLVRREFHFHKERGLALSDQCANCRHKARMALRTPRKLWQRKCSHCGEAITTSYAPEREEKVLCEKCYLKEVY